MPGVPTKARLESRFCKGVLTHLLCDTALQAEDAVLAEQKSKYRDQKQKTRVDAAGDTA